MSATDTLNKVRTLLGLETKLEQMKLENGTLLEADKFEAGQPVFIVTEDEKVALPVGTYQLESGLSLSVEKEGIIAELGEEKEEEVAEEVAEEKEEMGYVSREEFELALEEIKKMIDDLKPEEEEEKEEIEEKEEEVEEEDEQAELKAELSKPASAPIKHNPEAENSKKFNLKYANNRKLSTFDIILQKLNK